MALNIVSNERAGGSLVVVAEGEVDVSCASELRDAIDAALAGEAQAVTVDLAQVSYIDSTGIGVLVGAAHRAKEAGKTFAAINPQRNVRRVLDLLRVTAELGAAAQEA